MNDELAKQIIELLEQISISLEKLNNPMIYWPTETHPDTSPPRYAKGCPVCGIGADGQPYGYVCNRADCPTQVTCG